MMEQTTVFDHLVRELDDQERRSLLVRLQGSTPVYAQPLQPEDDSQSIFVLEEELARLNLLQRLIFFFLSLFSRKDRETLLKERYLKRLALAVARSHPDLIVAAGLGPKLHEALLGLRLQARRLSAPLTAALEENRREFLAFLARNELKDFLLRLEEETDPQEIWENGHFREEKQVRALMLQRFQQLLDTIPQSAKNRVGEDARALFALRIFSSHPFDNLLSAFQGEQNPTAEPAALLKPLKALAGALQPLLQPPSAQALYDLFLFLHRERLEEREFDLENQLLEDMSAMHAALAGIRSFHDQVPLHSLLRLLTRDPGYYPSPSTTMADWFSFFKDYWRQWVHRRYLEFYLVRRRNALLRQCLEFLDVKSLPALENYRADKFGPGTPVRHELSLSFVKGFLQVILAPLSRALKLIYLNGEFYKEDNRHAYTDAYLFLSEADRKIEELQATLGPQGELRAAIQEVKSQGLGERLRQKRIADILGRADGQARILLDGFLEQLQNLVALLYGILKGQPGDRYDTLVNLNKIGGSENRELRQAWRRALEQGERASDLLKLIRELEINRRDD